MEMNLFQFLANVKQSFGDNLLPVRLIPAERNRNSGQCMKAKRHPLIILLLVFVISSAVLNGFLLMKYSKTIGRDKYSYDKREYKSDGAKPDGMIKPSQDISFVSKVTENRDFKRIQSLAKEIPAAKLDDAAVDDIRKVYSPEKYGPKYQQGENQNNREGDVKEEAREDIKGNEDNEEEDMKKEREKPRPIKVVTGDKEDGPKRIKPRTQRRNVPPDLYKVAPDIFDNVPLKFEAGLKNPCWRVRGETNWTLQCLPYFFLLGMPKCGTSDLWYKIIQHPQIMSLVKEPHWWSRGRIGVRFPKMPFTGYLKLPESLYSEVQKGRNDVIYGDGSASTLWDNRGWQRFFPSNASEPPFVVADIIREILPDAKLIIILRDPIERLYSDYMFGRDNSSPTDFHQRVVQSIKSYEECRGRRSLRYCSYDETNEDVEARLRIGFYSLYLREWVRLYPIDQIAILELTQWRDNCTDILPQLYAFLELDAMDENQIQEICSLRKVNDNSIRKHRVGGMLPETRKLLEDLYRPFNDDLTKLLGNDIFEW